MPQKYLNLAGHQRVDLADMQAVAQDTPARILEELSTGFLLPPGGFSVVTGFRPTASGSSTVAVGADGTPNVAWLGRRRDDATVQLGNLAMCGPQSLSVSVSNYPTGSFGIYVRVQLSPVTPQQRVFWDQSGLQEVAQLTPTIQQAAWEVRIEANPPGTGEWYRVGTAQVTAQGSGSGSTVTVSDSRRLYFEGQVGESASVTWGSAADRTSERGAMPIGNLQTKLDALRSCITDIKGRGLGQWYETYINGLNIGRRWATTDLPVLERVAVGDSAFYLQGSAFTPILSFGVGGLISYSRLSNVFAMQAGGLPIATFAASGYNALGRVPNLVSAVQPLTVWNYAPYGRVAQFANDDSSAASISIGNTGNNGGRVDFATPSITDFQSTYWSIGGTFGTSTTFTVAGRLGTPLTIAMNTATGDYTTTLYSKTLYLNGQDNIYLAANGGRVNTNGLFVTNDYLFVAGSRIPAKAQAFLALHYDQAANKTTVSGTYAGTTNGTATPSGNFLLTLDSALPANPVILLSAPRQNGSAVILSYSINSDRKGMTIYGEYYSGSQTFVSFDLLILNGQ